MAIKTPKESGSIEQSNEEIVKSFSKEIEVDLNDEPETMQVDFEDETLANSFASKSTKPSQNSPKIDENKPIDEIQKEVADYEANKSGKLEYKDLLKQAEFFINLFDTGISTLFNFIARGSHASDYKMVASDKKLLIEQLALILAKYQSKFKIEYTFFLGLIIMYAPMTVAAMQNRKKSKPVVVKQPKAENARIPIERTPTDPGYKHDETKDLPPVPKTDIMQPLEKIDLPSAAEPKPKREYKKKGPREKAY